MNRTIAILAGGLGTRVATLTGGTLAKAMLPVAGAPFIDHKLAETKRLGARRVVLLLGHGSDQIESYVGDGSRWGVELVIVRDGAELLGTGGALARAAHTLGDAPWITYGDTLLDVDLDDAESHAADRGYVAVLTVLRNHDRWEPSNTTVRDGLVVAYRKGDPSGTHKHIDYGYLRIPLNELVGTDAAAFDLRVVVDRLIDSHMLLAYEAHERFHDIGTPEALSETDAWLRSRQAECT